MVYSRELRRRRDCTEPVRVIWSDSISENQIKITEGTPAGVPFLKYAGLRPVWEKEKYYVKRNSEDFVPGAAEGAL